MKNKIILIIAVLFLFNISGIHGFISKHDCEHSSSTPKEHNNCPCVFHSNGQIDIISNFNIESYLHITPEKTVKTLNNQLSRKDTYQLLFFLRSPPA